jgi:hypothetical protein
MRLVKKRRCRFAMAAEGPILVISRAIGAVARLQRDMSAAVASRLEEGLTMVWK